jgi:CHAD domain-containing protein
VSAIDLLPPEEVGLEATRDLLRERLQVVGGEPLQTERTFFDTFDGLVRANGLTMLHERDRLSLIDRGTGEERAGLPSAAPQEPLLAGELSPGRLRDTLLHVVDVRALLPVARLRCRMAPLSLLDSERKTVVRMTIEEPSLLATSSVPKRLPPRLRMVAVRGYNAELDRAREVLEQVLGFRASPELLVDEAVRLAGRSPSGTSSKVNIPLAFDQRADAAAVAVLSRLAEVIESNLPGAIADIDSEFLHDLRVAVRRSRAVQRELKRAFPPERLAHFRAEFRWLQQVTGQARDLDVYTLEFDAMRALLPDEMRPELDPVLAVLHRRRTRARVEMADALRSDRCSQLRRSWPAFLDELVALTTDDRPDATRPIGAVVGTRIQKVYRRIVKLGSRIGAQSPPEDYHQLRKQGKELRYLLELFATRTHPDEVVKPMIKALKSLQDVLGRHQDREVQVTTLRSLRDDVAVLSDGPAALMAMGALVLALREDERDARQRFDSRFDAFASKSQRRLVRDAFG